ncbi:MAG TPA: hypothetical protein VFE31_10410 [Opitutaceae bacterium]|jgi:hypothetical protein|nr:hypothetical protein [Opitutaceae bacterium]
MIGGTTLSAGLADAQTQIDQALGAPTTFGADSIAQFAAAYRAANGGPTLALLGFNPFQFVATGAFHELYWGMITVSLGIMAIIAQQHVLNNRYSVRGRHPLNGLAQIYFRLATGVLLIANLPLVYGVLMTVNRTLTTAVAAIGTQAMTQTLQAGGIGPLTLAQTRAEAVRQAAERRVIALYPDNASRAEMLQIGAWYNATAAAVNSALAAAQLSGTLPELDDTRWNDAGVPDDQVIAAIGRSVVQNFGPLILDLAALPVNGGPLPVAFPSGGAGSLPPLSAALSGDDNAAAQALSLPAVPASSAAFESARSLYAKNVLGDTLTYLDGTLLPILGASPSLAARAKAWFSQSVEHAAAAAAGGLFAAARDALDWTARSVGIVLTRMVSFLFAAGTSALLEIDLFVLVLALPFWLLPATEEAFHGTLRALGALAAAAPAYQFLMLFVDALMGLVLRYLILGPLAAGPASAGAAAGGAAYAAAGAVAIIGTGGEIIPLAMFCYLVAYVFLAIYLALKTPRIVAAFLKGGGAAGAFLATFATGLITGAMNAFATASAGAGGSLSARWLQAASAALPRAPASRGNASGPVGPFVSSRFARTAGFGAAGFVAGLGAKSPADGALEAMDQLAAFRKLRDKESGARQKADAKAEKAAAKKPPARRAAK